MFKNGTRLSTGNRKCFPETWRKTQPGFQFISFFRSVIDATRRCKSAKCAKSMLAVSHLLRDVKAQGMTYIGKQCLNGEARNDSMLCAAQRDLLAPGFFLAHELLAMFAVSVSAHR